MINSLDEKNLAIVLSVVNRLFEKKSKEISASVLSTISETRETLDTDSIYSSVREVVENTVAERVPLILNEAFESVVFDNTLKHVIDGVEHKYDHKLKTQSEMTEDVSRKVDERTSITEQKFRKELADVNRRLLEKITTIISIQEESNRGANKTFVEGKLHVDDLFKSTKREIDEELTRTNETLNEVNNSLKESMDKREALLRERFTRELEREVNILVENVAEESRLRSRDDADLCESFETFKKNVNEDFTSMGSSFSQTASALSAQLSGHGTRIGNLESSVSDIDLQVKSSSNRLDSVNDAVRKSIGTVSDRLDVVNRNLSNLKADREDITLLTKRKADKEALESLRVNLTKHADDLFSKVRVIKGDAGPAAKEWEFELDKKTASFKFKREDWKQWKVISLMSSLENHVAKTVNRALGDGRALGGGIATGMGGGGLAGGNTATTLRVVNQNGGFSETLRIMTALVETDENGYWEFVYPTNVNINSVYSFGATAQIVPGAEPLEERFVFVNVQEADTTRIDGYAVVNKKVTSLAGTTSYAQIAAPAGAKISITVTGSY